MSALDPLDFAPCDGLIASPPCQAFSMADKGAGRKAMRVYHDAIRAWRNGTPPDRERLDAACSDERAHLVLEPLRWVYALRPRWVACEQVEPVLPLWEEMADALRELGYRTWTGVLSSERFGVPQTRRRAILLASFDRDVSEPPATHARYIASRRRTEATERLFDAPEPERIVAPEDRGLLPWVSMAEALGWQPGLREHHVPRGAGLLERHGARADVPDTEPAPTVRSTERSAAWKWRTSTMPNSAERDLDEPAPTIAFGHHAASTGWHLRAGTNDHDTARSADEPAATLRFGGRLNDVSWVDDRPATVVQGDDRVAKPGHVGNPGKEWQFKDAIPVTEAEALTLQGFDPAHPVQGTHSKRFQQIGNAIPLALALACLRVVA